MLNLETKNQLNTAVATKIGFGIQIFSGDETFLSRLNDVRNAIIADQTLITFDEHRGRPQSFLCWALVNDSTFEKIKKDNAHSLSGCEWFEGFNLVIYLSYVRKDNLFHIRREVLTRVRSKLQGKTPEKLLIIHRNEKCNFECNLSYISRCQSLSVQISEAEMAE